MGSFKVVSLNVSKKTGTIKRSVKGIILDQTGVRGDAHAGNWHRQISLLGVESYQKASKEHKHQFNHGDYAENITTRGFELHKAQVFDRFVNEDMILEVTQIGKKCHKGCEIMKQVGQCIMPLEGIFCRVVKGGELSPGAVFKHVPKEISVQVITLSDRASRGEYEDRSGPHIENMISGFFKGYGRGHNVSCKILPDDAAMLETLMKESTWAGVDILITTGGTGIGPRDITPETVRPLLDKEIPGIMEHIRVKFGSEKPNALISRSIAGVMNRTLVYVLPGSVKAVTEYLNEIMPTIEHSMRMLHGIDSH